MLLFRADGLRRDAAVDSNDVFAILTAINGDDVVLSVNVDIPLAELHMDSLSSVDSSPIVNGNRSSPCDGAHFARGTSNRVHRREGVDHHPLQQPFFDAGRGGVGPKGIQPLHRGPGRRRQLLSGANQLAVGGRF